ncbi:MAG: methyltransferase domain-containing protein [Candidatus Pacearchaeota archaeon]
MQPAKPIIVDIIKQLDPSKVLDLGCGNCKFSKIFIEKGISVTGVDKERIAEQPENFKFIQQDLSKFKFETKYDLIIGSGILHFFEIKEASNLIRKMQENTILGGFHFLICMSQEESNDKIHFYPNKEELNKLYFGWEIIHNHDCLSKKHGEDMHQHKIIIFLAKKI